MVKKKRQSKRMSLHDKYKIVKRSNEHHRKERRLAKKRALAGGVTQKRKDPGIPNLWPFKEQLLRKMKASQEEATRKRAAALAAKKKKKTGSGVDLTDAASRSEDFVGDSVDTSETALGNSSKKFMGTLKQVVEDSDVLLHVVDARDPIGYRSKILESAILKHPDKRLLLVLNKTDLVPDAVVKDWLDLLRRDFPTVPFSASQTTKRSSASTDLFQLLKNYTRNVPVSSSKKVKRSITVGVVGFPNVGKSSIINALKRKVALKTSSTAGSTRVAQAVQLDKKIRMIDSPGVFLPERDNASVLKLCLDENADAVGVVEKLVRLGGIDRLISYYGLPKFSTHTEFLFTLAQERGKLLKGGVPDLEKTAKMVMDDWARGRVQFWVKPPVLDEKVDPARAKIVQQWQSEFDFRSDDDEEDEDEDEEMSA